MFSTIALVKNSKFSGKIAGTHQKIALAARLSLNQTPMKGKYFPSGKEIIHFEGMRGPDGLKRKSPGVDEPSYMLTKADLDKYDEMMTSAGQLREGNTPIVKQHRVTKRDLELKLAELAPAGESGHEKLDERSVITIIHDHRWNLVKALKNQNHVRAAFEAAWMEHAVVDGLTPAHHFPLSDVKDELMADKDFMRVFGQPIKGIMHGRNMLETMRNNWLYWGAGGHMSKHIAYEYGVLMIAASISAKKMAVKLTEEDLAELDFDKTFRTSLAKIQQLKIYDRFREEGWTTELAVETKEMLLPEMVRTVTLGWYSAMAEAYKVKI